MKKIILTEEQLKRVIDNVVYEQTLTKNTEETGLNQWRVCGTKVIEEEGRYFAEDRSGRVEIPFLDELKGTIKGRGNNATIVLDELTKNALRVGNKMKMDGVCDSSRLMDYRNADGWICCINRNEKFLRKNTTTGKDELVNAEPFPVYSSFSYRGRLGTERYPDESVSPAKTVKQKEGSIVQYRKTRTENFVLEVSREMIPGEPINVPTSQTTPQPEPKPQPQPEPKPNVVQLDIQSPFEFDKVTLTSEAEQKFTQFIQNVKANYQGATGDVEVLCSASIDADPAKKAQYNKKLSENRALTIVNRLKTETGITTMNFIPKGIGQTDQFAPGLKWPEVTDQNKTAPNRRLIIKLPKIIKK
jgi:outer membrane protein OmpA-like peptidoglycan-associated protein